MLFSTYLLISNKRKKLNRNTKYITPQDQTYCFNYLIAEHLLFFHIILTSFAKKNTRVAIEITPNGSARYELTFSISSYFLNKDPVDEKKSPADKKKLE